MKKSIILLLFIIVSVCADAQSYVGMRGSFNMTSLSTGSVKTRPGFSVGGMFSTQISDNWYFQPAVLYSLWGSKTRRGFQPAHSAYTYNLEVPLTFSRRIGDDEISFGLDCGPFMRYALHGSYWVDNLETKKRTQPNIFDHQKRFDVGPQLGFSVIVYGLYIGYSFQYGLIKPWDNHRGNYYNSCMTFGYLFELQ